ncbi:hypothetical protein MAALD49_29720 [Marinobacter shengliensis]|nr:hypothetical protein MAALD49_29720 [Marinobacter shengliensis]
MPKRPDIRMRATVASGVPGAASPTTPARSESAIHALKQSQSLYYILNKPEQSKLSKRSIFSSLRASALPTLNLQGEAFQISHS